MATLLVGESVSVQPNAFDGAGLESGELSRWELAEFNARQMGALGDGDAFLPSRYDLLFSQIVEAERELEAKRDATPQPDKHFGNKVVRGLVGIAVIFGGVEAVQLLVETPIAAYADPTPPQPPNSRHCRAGEIPDHSLDQVWTNDAGVQQVLHWCRADSTPPPPPPTTPHTTPPATNPPSGGGGGITPTPTTVHRRAPAPTTTQPPANVDGDPFPVGPFEADDNSPGIGQAGLDILKADMAARGLSWDALDQQTKDVYTIVAISTAPDTFKSRLPGIYNVPETTIAKVTTTVEPSTEPATTQEVANTTTASTVAASITTSVAATTTSGTEAQSGTTTTVSTPTSALSGASVSSSTEQGGAIAVATTGPQKEVDKKKDSSNTLAFVLIAAGMTGGGIIIATRLHNKDKQPRGKNVFDIPFGSGATTRGISQRSHHRDN